MEVVVIGMENRYAAVAEELRRRGIRVIMVPGNTLTIYAFNNGFQELDGEEAERYIQRFLNSVYIVEYF
jgi:hypothetical protein